MSETLEWVPTTEVLQRFSALKMVSNKLKKLMAISSTVTGLLWDSSTILQQGWFIILQANKHNCVITLDTSLALDSLLLDVGQWCRGCVRQGVDDVGQWSWWCVWRCKSFTGILRFHFYCPHFLLPPLIFHLLLRQRQIKECWKKRCTKHVTVCHELKVNKTLA